LIRLGGGGDTFIADFADFAVVVEVFFSANLVVGSQI
jgi:hypothetical protein